MSYTYLPSQIPISSSFMCSPGPIHFSIPFCKAFRHPHKYYDQCSYGISIHTLLCISYHSKGFCSPPFFISLLYFTNPSYRGLPFISLSSTRDSFYRNHQWTPCNIELYPQIASSCVHINNEYKFHLARGTPILPSKWYDQTPSLAASSNNFYHCEISSPLLFTFLECKLHIFQLVYASQRLHFL